MHGKGFAWQPAGRRDEPGYLMGPTGRLTSAQRRVFAGRPPPGVAQSVGSLVSGFHMNGGSAHKHLAST